LIIRKLFLAISLLLISSSLSATTNLSDLVGYQIIHKGYITGYQDRGKPAKTDWTFEGCDYDRTIVIDDRFAVYCRSYHYHYAYHPEVVILSNGRQAKMLIDDTLFDISLRE
jgi:hypothetical protein